MGHIKMMAAAQPFISGAISKTVNLPHEATVEQIAEAYTESWRQGLKAVAIYRDGSKGVQPLNTSQDAKKNEPTVLDAAGARVLASLAAGAEPAEADVKTLEAKISDKLEVSAKQVFAASQAFQKTLDSLAGFEARAAALAAKPAPAAPAIPTPSALANQDLNAPPKAVRHRLPEERASVTHKFSIAGHEGYITVGLYPTGQPGEIFIKMAKEGSTVSGLMDAFATSISLALQHGVPLKVLCEKFAHTRFEPSGWTGNEQIGYAKSLMDYIFRWLQLRFLSGTQLPLFAGLVSQAQQLPAPPPSMVPEADLDSEPDSEPSSVIPGVSGAALTKLVEDIARRLNQVNASAVGSVPEIRASTADAPFASSSASSVLKLADRGLYHAADAMREMYDMGDAPSCGTCGAIMVRNGSCYRCMSCGSTSGCS
jgi:ribonucleoside-diphosphate reductase alpha chain